MRTVCFFLGHDEDLKSMEPLTPVDTANVRSVADLGPLRCIWKCQRCGREETEIRGNS